MQISGMSGNEIFCLAQKGFAPGEIVVGNSVCSLGVAGSIASIGTTLAGGEITQVTGLISEGRHAAITRMEDEAKKHGASGVTGVVAELKSLAGYTEFLAQGTGVHEVAAAAAVAKAGGGKPFSTAASGVELYCHLDAGYRPIKFALGNVAYALGLARGITGGLRTLAQGEVKDFSQMYNEVRHVALARLKAEAANYGANAVVDVDVKILPYGPGTVEFLLTGTASHHPAISPGPVTPDKVVTSELTGEELWNLAKMGYAPLSLVFATSIYSLGLVGGIGALFRGLSRGELPEVTALIYRARENCLEMIRAEAKAMGAERVIGNKLTILELSPGLIEVFAVGTAIRKLEGTRPATESLIPQAVILDPEAIERRSGAGLEGLRPGAGLGGEGGGRRQQGNPAIALVVVGGFFLLFGCIFAAAILTAVFSKGH